MSCRCDILVHPQPLNIAAGLVKLPRQIAGFPEFRQAMLHSVGSAEHAAALGPWRASGDQDLGVMLLEMWAYLADSLAFYDEVHAHECYLRTARRDISVTALVARLGYRPKPALAATVELALRADGRTPVQIPLGVAFRSGPFGVEAPQVFELDAPLVIHPLRNRWPVLAPRPLTVSDEGGPGTLTSELVLDARRSAKWAAADIALVQASAADPETWSAVEVVESEPVTAASEPTTRLVVSKLLEFAAETPLAEVKLLKATRSAGLWTRTTSAGVASPDLYLNGVYRDIAAGDWIALRCTAPGLEGIAYYRVTEVSDVTLTVPVASGDASYNAELPVTRLSLDTEVDDTSRGADASWSNTQRAQLTVHYGFREAGRLAAPAKTVVGVNDPLWLSNAAQPVADTGATRLMLSDVNGVAHGAYGSIDFATGLLSPTSFDPARAPLTLPVTVHGNIARATRGETVTGEVLGSGDATLSGQSFSLNKSPLTYVAAASAAEGFASTLRVWVDGRLWREVPSFFEQDAEAEVYVVTLDAAGKATLRFGDGEFGKRLPSGTDNVVASYRFGAGAASPPAGSIAQIARGAERLSGVLQLLPATGGSAAEASTSARSTAPRRALTLGRAVSIQDMEAFASQCAGVSAVSVEWAFSKTAQRPVVQVWVVGDGAEAAVRARLTAVTDPTTPIVVSPATAVSIELALEVKTDPNFIATDVLAEVVSSLIGADGELSLLRLGIGKPVYFSRVFARVHAVAGVTSVSLTWLRAGVLQSGYGDTPGPGKYFSFAPGITLNGEVYANG